MKYNAHIANDEIRNNAICTNKKYSQRKKDIIISNILKSYTYCSTKKLYSEMLPLIFDFVLKFKCRQINNGLFYSLLSDYLEQRTHYKISAHKYLNTLAKICTFYLYIEGEISLTYSNIEFLTTKSTALETFMTSILGMKIKKVNFQDLRFDMLLIVMFKNKTINVFDITNEMLIEYREFIYSEEESVSSHKLEYHRLHNRLYIRGIVSENSPRIDTNLISNNDYFDKLADSEVKTAILYYIENAKLKTNSKPKIRPHLLHFGLFAETNYKSVSLQQYNSFIAEHYKNILKEEINIGKISKNWACNCLVRVNSFFNFLIDYEYRVCQNSRDIFIPNIFDERNVEKNRRSNIKEHIIEQIRHKSESLDEIEKALVTIYLGTGIRLNELAVFRVENFHDNASNLIYSSDLAVDPDIGWIKVTGTKIQNKERIILINKEIFKAFEILKRDRINKFGNLEKMIHPIPEVGEANFLLLNNSARPYKTLGNRIRTIFEKLDLRDENGKQLKITAHQFRHSYLTDLVKHGCPIHLAMDFMGHVDPQMLHWYNHHKKDLLEIAREESIVSNEFEIKIEDNRNTMVVKGDEINRQYSKFNKYYIRGGICTTDEFQDECDYIDCIECKQETFKTNYSFVSHLNKSMQHYYSLWISEENHGSDRAIYLLYLCRLYEKLLRKVENNKYVHEVSLNFEERSRIAKEVGL
ncbi:tyrosine-type recombinase/integrase [Alkaliphilus peptidifermentans]|uniref:Site-specific recombinase XerD n=1 Tax=Alkaliphilus peptidifermentans DSM 18978 TaxID=1120976 RepID=A0A1G5JHE7_9FIRM|nr:site-specific integrase [Alkaliphilus peptidifermentans]SCY87765.1 Site-specific recombinase XerD [Alkaliphilus peptidifermentans DSM 18978]